MYYLSSLPFLLINTVIIILIVIILFISTNQINSLINFTQQKELQRYILSTCLCFSFSFPFVFLRLIFRVIPESEDCSFWGRKTKRFSRERLARRNPLFIKSFLWNSTFNLRFDYKILIFIYFIISLTCRLISSISFI